MSSSPVLLLLGAGPNVGQAVAHAFAEKGYKIASVSRTKKDTEEDTSEKIHISSDFSKPESVADVFSQVEQKLGTPTVVVYNAAAVTFGTPEDPLAISLTDFTKNLNINTTSAFSAAQQAALAFKNLPDSASKTFIYTGNILNFHIMPPLLDLGVGKSGTSHIIRVAAEAYKDKGFKFYYADERKDDGSSAGRFIDGESHAKLYVELSEGKAQETWLQTFVKGKGYKKFNDEVR